MATDKRGGFQQLSIFDAIRAPLSSRIESAAGALHGLVTETRDPELQAFVRSAADLLTDSALPRAAFLEAREKEEWDAAWAFDDKPSPASRAYENLCREAGLSTPEEGSRWRRYALRRFNGTAAKGFYIYERVGGDPEETEWRVWCREVVADHPWWPLDGLDERPSIALVFPRSEYNGFPSVWRLSKSRKLARGARWQLSGESDRTIAEYELMDEPRECSRDEMLNHERRLVPD